MSDHTFTGHGPLLSMLGQAGSTPGHTVDRATVKVMNGRATDSVFSSKLSNLRSAVPQACLPTRPACHGALCTSVVASRRLRARPGLSKALHCLRSVLSNNIPQQLTLDRDETCNAEAATDRRQASWTCAQSGLCKNTSTHHVSVTGLSNCRE